MIRDVVVVIPAKDEEALVERCLRSVSLAAEALAGARPGIRVTSVLVADACTDATPQLARRIPGFTVLESIAGRVGSARAFGIDHVLADLRDEDSGAVWIANTDADSAVPPVWLLEQVRLAEAGADVVVGTVRPDPSDLTPLQNERWLATHRPGHPNGHVHGANLGVRASHYLSAGGFSAVAEHEDNLLVERLRADGARIVASDVCQVVTSGRTLGRTPGGYAGYLAATL